MSTQERWKEAQEAEGEFWNGLTKHEDAMRGILDDNRLIAAQVEAWLPALPKKALEIGVGGLGVGTLGFLRKIPMRVGIDPLPLQALSCSETMRTIIEELRKPVEFQISAGERTPFPDSSFDLVLCCNVLDHVQDPAAVLREVSRVLQPGGYFYLAVDVFSPAGLAKWKFWTRHRHSTEILVRAHPHRFLYGGLTRLISHAGLHVMRWEKRSSFEKLFGRSRRLATLSQK